MNLYLHGVAAALLLVGGTSARASTQAGAPQTSPFSTALESCQRITDDAQRLRCLDESVARLLQAQRSGELSLIGRTQAREARRSLFGFSVPKLPFLGGDEDESGEITAIVQAVRAAPDGRYRIRLESGAVWETVERPRQGDGPKRGSTVRIRKAALGSYLMNIDGNRAVRARRAE
jgi:hypothetical protein